MTTTAAAGRLERCARGFDRLAPVWDVLATGLSGGAIPRSQTRFLPELTAPRRALVVGGGTGGFLVGLLLSCAPQRVVAVDPSAAMLRRSAARVAARVPAAVGRVDYRQGSVETIGRDERFDVVCTHFVLDLFEPQRLREVMRRIDGALEPSGAWLCADFAPPSGPLRPARRALLGTLYAAFRAACAVEARRLPPIAETFAELGYAEERAARPALGILSTALYRRQAGAA